MLTCFMNRKRILAFVPLLMLFLVSCATAKVAESSAPANIQSEISEFRFEDYGGLEDFKNAMKAFFPVGTKEADIEDVLVRYGGATKYDDGLLLNPGKRTVRYYKIDEQTKNMKCMYFVFAAYNNENVLSKEIWSNYECDGP